ncbi:hypothetical protein BDY19DRAFT_754405 [Irpex rosettiformis]|uniref:Uncharacterized protein n=1 Tax=Irpex rosettiformis TaxID=378272 RepID=A0ACB8U851_9APHY|nr:hypothetical protein BDY19DRAFT_754405 [Irpex rosettiformis]
MTVTKDAQNMVRALVCYSPLTLENEYEKLREANVTTELELSKALQHVDELKRDKVATANAANSALEELAKMRSKPDYEKRRLRQQLECTNRELASSQTRLAESQRILDNVRYELDALTASHYAVASEKQMLELALLNAHTQILAETDSARVALNALYLEQRKTTLLEKKFLASKAIAHQDISTGSKSQDTDDTDALSAITILELELERDMYKAQEQEALQALAMEKQLRLTAEQDCDNYRENEQLAIAAIEAHKMAYIVAEQDKMILAAQLEDACSRIIHLAPQLEQGFGHRTQTLQMEDETLQIEFRTTISDTPSDVKGQ